MGNKLPDEAQNLDLGNVIALDIKKLKEISKRTESRTKNVSDFILNNVAPTILSFEGASSIVRTTMSDGLSIEVEADVGMSDVLKELTRLDLIFKYLRYTQFPVSMKRRYMRMMVDELVKRSVLKLSEHDKRKTISDLTASVSKHLEGVVMKKRSDNKAVNPGNPLTESVPTALKHTNIATKRPRASNKPREGF